MQARATPLSQLAHFSATMEGSMPQLMHVIMWMTMEEIKSRLDALNHGPKVYARFLRALTHNAPTRKNTTTGQLEYAIYD